MKPVFAIDGGNKLSGFAILESKNKILRDDTLTFGKIPNEDLLPLIESWAHKADFALEFPYPRRGMLVAYEVFLMTAWLGRFQQVINQLGGQHFKIFRHRQKATLCNSGAANDSQIRKAVLDILGTQGTKLSPGPTYGVKADVWQALATGLTFIIEGDSEALKEKKDEEKKLQEKPKIAF